MRAHEILEGVEHDYLFHGTPISRATKIVAENQINTGYAGNEDIEGVSLSRNWRFAHGFSAQQETGVVFVLDRRKLQNRFRITQDVDLQHGGNEEQEEVVHGNITPLDRYLVSINCDIAAIHQLMEIVKTDPDPFHKLSEWLWSDLHLEGRDIVLARFDAFLSNPKINRWHPRS